MKFQQRLVILFVFICVGILYIWVKNKTRNGRRNPVVAASNDENLLRSLLLDGAFDFNNHIHTDPKISSRDRRSTKTSDKTISKETVSVRHNIPTSNELKITTSQKNTAFNKPAWQLWHEMVKEREVTQPGQEGMLRVDAIVKALQTQPVIQMSVGYRGTQLKASMFLQGKQRTVFKPKRLVLGYIIAANWQLLLGACFEIIDMSIISMNAW